MVAKKSRLTQGFVAAYRANRAQGMTAEAAYWSVIRHEHFLKTYKADLKAYKRRATAAKRGWKTRRKNAA